MGLECHVLAQDGRVAITVNGDANFAAGRDVNVTGGGYPGSTGPGPGGSEGLWRASLYRCAGDGEGSQA